MITTKDQAKPSERCNSRFPFSRLDVQCVEREGHDGPCADLVGGGRNAFGGICICRYTWTPSLLPVMI